LTYPFINKGFDRFSLAILNITVNSGVFSELAEGFLLENRLKIVVHNELFKLFLNKNILVGKRKDARFLLISNL